MKNVILKLVSGETIIGELTASGDTSVSIRRPIQVRMIPTMGSDGEYHEQPVITMYSQFTFEEGFEFKNSHIVYCKELYKRISDFYQKTSEEMYSVEITKVMVRNNDHIDSLDEELDISSQFANVMDDMKKNIH